MKPLEVDQTPLYLACILMGAMSPDHEHIRMTADDVDRYYGPPPQ